MFRLINLKNTFCRSFSNFVELLKRLKLCSGRESSIMGDRNVLPLPSDRYPRRASDGCASIQYRSISERNDDDTAQLKAIQQEHQALQVFLSQFQRRSVQSNVS